MKLAILDADILRDDLIEHYHSYGQMFRQLFDKVAPHWTLTICNVVRGEYPSLDDVDALLVTGSRHDAFSEETWAIRLREFCRHSHRSGKILFGICFGHQLLAHALGGQVARSQRGWGLGLMRYDQCEQPSFSDDEGPVSLLTSHQDQVVALPPGGRLLLSNDFCPNAAFYIPDQVLCFQGHPEFSGQYLRDLLEGRRDTIEISLLDQAIASTTDDHEGVRVAHWMVRFAMSSTAATNSG